MDAYLNGRKILTKGTDESLFHFEKVVSQTSAKERGSNMIISAPLIKGYKFLFWLQSATSGSVTGTYVQIPTDQTTKIWMTGDALPSTNATSAIAIAVYIKDDFK